MTCPRCKGPLENGLCAKPCVTNITNTFSTPIGTITVTCKFIPGVPCGKEFDRHISWRRNLAQTSLASQLLQRPSGVTVEL